MLDAKGGILAEPYGEAFFFFKQKTAYEISPQHLFAWRKAARTGLLGLRGEEGALFVPVITSGDSWTLAGKPGESQLIKIEIAGAVVHAERGVDPGFLIEVLRAVKAAA